MCSHVCSVLLAGKLRAALGRAARRLSSSRGLVQAASLACSRVGHGARLRA